MVSKINPADWNYLTQRSYLTSIPGDPDFGLGHGQKFVKPRARKILYQEAVPSMGRVLSEHFLGAIALKSLQAGGHMGTVCSLDGPLWLSLSRWGGGAHPLLTVGWPHLGRTGQGGKCGDGLRAWALAGAPVLFMWHLLYNRGQLLAFLSLCLLVYKM